MSLLDDLKAAYEQQNWSIIKDIYKNLSGQDLLTPLDTPVEKKKKGRPSKKDASVKPQDIMTFPQKEIYVAPKENKLVKGGRTEPIRRFDRSFFTDDGIEHANESIKNRPELGVQPAHTKKRQANVLTLVEVECCKCGKRERVQSQFAVTYSSVKAENTYKCNDCCVRK